MNNPFSVWFSDYDSRGCKLFRAALTLKNEPWTYTRIQSEASWWIVDLNAEIDVSTLVSSYEHQIKSASPVVIILKSTGDNHFYDSWASVRSPMNFAMFFRWVDMVIEHGAASIVRSKQSHLAIIESFNGHEMSPEFTSQEVSYTPDKSQLEMGAPTDRSDSQADRSPVEVDSSQPVSFETSSNLPENGSDTQPSSSVESVSLEKDDAHVNAKPWKRSAFRLLIWPNVAMYGTDHRLVLLCSKLLRSFVTWETLQRFQFDEELLTRLLSDAHEQGMLVYEDQVAQPAAQSTDSTNDQEKPVAQDKADAPVVYGQQATHNQRIQITPPNVQYSARGTSQQSELKIETSDTQETPAQPSQLQKKTAPLVVEGSENFDGAETLAGEHNENSVSLLQSITKFFKRS